MTALQRRWAIGAALVALALALWLGLGWGTAPAPGSVPVPGTSTAAARGGFPAGIPTPAPLQGVGTPNAPAPGATAAPNPAPATRVVLPGTGGGTGGGAAGGPATPGGATGIGRALPVVTAVRGPQTEARDPETGIAFAYASRYDLVFAVALSDGSARFQLGDRTTGRPAALVVVFLPRASAAYGTMLIDAAAVGGVAEYVAGCTYDHPCQQTPPAIASPAGPAFWNITPDPLGGVRGKVLVTAPAGWLIVSTGGPDEAAVREALDGVLAAVRFP